MKPCLSLLKDDERKTTFCVGFGNNDAAPNYDTLRQSTLVNQVKISNLGYGASSKRIFELAFALRTDPSVTSVRFEDCMICDLGPLCLALTGKDQLAKLYFVKCELGSAAAENLRLMLELNSIAVLSFDKCQFKDVVTRVIETGMRSNQSLLSFVYTHTVAPLEITRGVHQMMRSSQSLVDLKLTIQDNMHWELFHAAVRLETLQSLALYESTLELEAMEGLTTMCIVIQSLKTLTLLECCIAEIAAKRLLRTLADNEHLESFGLVRTRHSTYLSTIKISTCGNVKVRNLGLTGTNFDLNAFSQTVDDAANNRHIKFLNLSNAIDSAQKFEKVCNVFLLQNLGPSELVMNGMGPHAVMLTEALQQNTNIKALTIANLGEEGGLTFAQGLASMHGLRSLQFGYEGSTENYTKEFFHALQQSLEVNTNLWTIALDGIYSDDPMAKQYLPRIRYLLAINRVGRHSLMTATVPTGVWAQILARSSKDIDGIYFVLTGKPDIVFISRKRKEHDDDDNE
jgi:hypothetical protein